MRRIDGLHLLYRFAGSRILGDRLRQEREHRSSAFGDADEADADRGDLPLVKHGTKTQDLFLPSGQVRKLAVDRPNQVWQLTSPTCPCASFIYLVAIIGWFTRRWLAGCSSRWMPSSALRHWHADIMRITFLLAKAATLLAATTTNETLRIR